MERTLRGAQSTLDNIYRQRGLTYDSKTGTARRTAGQTSVPSVVDSTRMTSPVTPYEIPEQAPAPTTGILGQTNSTIAGQVNTEATSTPPVPTPRESLGEQFKNYFSRITNQANDVTDIQEESGLEDKRKAASALASEIQQYDKDFRDKVKSIKENTLGKTTQGIEAEVSAEQDRYENTRANKYLSYSIANQDYQAAEQIVNDKVQALKDQNSQIFNALQFQSELISNDLSESEKLEMQANLDEKKYQRDLIANTYADVLKLVSESGVQVPASVYAAIDAAAKRPNATQADIYAAMGQYGSAITATGADAPLYAGLSPQTSTAVRSVVTGFKSEPQVTNFIAVQDGYNFSQSIPDDTTNPSDDQALIYSLAKVLDPGSVVREGEYATVQKYAQSWVKAYGSGVKQAIAGTGFLSKEARKNIKATIATKYQSTKNTYENLTRSYASQINNLTGRDDGDKFLRSYSTDQSTTPQAGVSDDDAYSLYLQTVGGGTSTSTPTNGIPTVGATGVQAQTGGQTRNVRNPLQGLSEGYRPFSFANFFR